ncbi:hypothetical protein ACOSQ4_031623 [Xanthoceras sorbifolium]
MQVVPYGIACSSCDHSFSCRECVSIVSDLEYKSWSMTLNAGRATIDYVCDLECRLWPLTLKAGCATTGDGDLECRS